MNRDVPRYTLIVQGRFHAFALAKALLELDAPVHVLTNYPAFVAERFGLPARHITGCTPLGLVHRFTYRWHLDSAFPPLVRFLHQSFSRWAARQIINNPPELIHPFSGVAKELYDELDRSKLAPVRILARGSAHIREQYRELYREGARAGNPKIDLPSTWMIRREMEEYRRSDHIATLSSYARSSFLSRGYSPGKIMLLPLGSDVSQFRPVRAIVDDRLKRLQSGALLSVLGTGSFCLRKGAIDFIAAARAMHGTMSFRWVGNITPDAAALAAAARDVIEFCPRVPEQELPRHYNAADVFVLPTVEDGFAITLAQARAACMPIIASSHSAAPDLIKEGTNGWVILPRDPAAMIDRLLRLHENRTLATAMVESLWQNCDTRDWLDVGRDFIELAAAALSARKKVA